MKVKFLKKKIIIPTYKEEKEEELPLFAFNRVHQRTSGDPYPNKVVLEAKRDELIYTTKSSKPVQLSKSDYALKLLQNVRDESHRFAITFQRSLRQKNTLKSELEKIELLGKKKATLLFDKFKSIDNIKNADICSLMQTEGIGKTLATNIYNYFHKE